MFVFVCELCYFNKNNLSLGERNTAKLREVEERAFCIL